MSHGFTGFLPERILKMLPPEQRATLGKAGMTAADVYEKAKIKNERDLQRLCESYLRLQGYEVIRSRMDKATSNNAGTPDHLICVKRYIPERGFSITLGIAIEYKMPGDDKLDKAQESMRKAMTFHPNAWHHHVVRSFDELKAMLRREGLQ